MNVLVHRHRDERTVTYELLYEGQGENGERFVVGLIEASVDERSGRTSKRSAFGRVAVGRRSCRPEHVSKAVIESYQRSLFHQRKKNGNLTMRACSTW